MMIFIFQDPHNGTKGGRRRVALANDPQEAREILHLGNKAQYLTAVQVERYLKNERKWQ